MRISGKGISPLNSLKPLNCNNNGSFDDTKKRLLRLQEPFLSGYPTAGLFLTLVPAYALLDENAR